MKKIILLLLIGFTAQAQMPFEQLDSLSTVISKWQKMTEKLSYKDLDSKLYELSFPEENFQVWSFDRLASIAVYKKQGEREFLSLTENVDLAKATGVSIAQDYFGVTFIRLDFPEGHLKTQIIEDGKPSKTENGAYLQFFCRYGALDTDKKFYFDKMFDLVYAFCNALKVEQGLTDVQTISDELHDWNKLSNEAFIAKHPKSLMVAQARANIAEKLKR